MPKTAPMKRLVAPLCLVMASFATTLNAQDVGWSAGYNTFGVPGLIDMPGALGGADGELSYNISHFKNQTRNTLTFQFSDRISASFRYSALKDVRSRPDPESPVFSEIFDRSFSVHYRFLDEGRWRPAMAVGINDLVGTGIYGGEYVVASKTINPRLRATLGIGWGRLGSYGGFTNPLGVIDERFETRPDTYDSVGGQFQGDSWFRGDAAFFGGLEWQATDRLRLVAEYSSDDYAREDGAAFDYNSPLNFGLKYRYNDRTTLSANYLYGSEIGVHLSYTFNPQTPRHGSGLDSVPPPVVRRADLSEVAARGTGLEDRTRSALAAQGLTLEGLELAGSTLRIQIRNDRYPIASQAVGRAARVLTRTAPAQVETFAITLAAQGMPVTTVTVRRVDMEQLEFHAVAPDLSRAGTRIADATQSPPPLDGRWPFFDFGVDPYLSLSFFDPDAPLRADLGIALKASYEPLPGLVFSGRVDQRLIGNLDEGDRPSDSVLPHVRSDAYLYFKGGATTLPELTAAYYFRPGDDLFGRVTAGYLERMFAGVSGEILWKPQNSRLALGAELNYVAQRDFDDPFGLQDYSVATGHLSAYYEFPGGYYGQIDAGRYLAGDVGATVTLAREFDNGWRVGAFATVTDVSPEEFGEGSFDKGILLTIPLDWITGKPDRTRIDRVIRPVQRDGGARLSVPGRLYPLVREHQATDLDATWGRFWR